MSDKKLKMRGSPKGSVITTDKQLNEISDDSSSNSFASPETRMRTDQNLNMIKILPMSTQNSVNTPYTENEDRASPNLS
jgi:hypothetical protein